MKSNTLIDSKHAMRTCCFLFLVFFVVIFWSFAQEDKRLFTQDKMLVSRSLEELTNILKSLDYNISALYELDRHFEITNTAKVVHDTCYFVNDRSKSSKDLIKNDFVFAGPKSMCDPDHELNKNALERMKMAPPMAYFAGKVDNVANVYFISKDKYLISSPSDYAYSVQANSFDKVIYNRPYWSNTLKYGEEGLHNRIVYTGEYEDLLTGKPVFTLTTGIYIKGEFKGILGIDILVDTLLDVSKEGYQITNEIGQNKLGLLTFSKSKPILVNNSETGLFLTINESRFEHLLHILEDNYMAIIVFISSFIVSILLIHFQYLRADNTALTLTSMTDLLTGLLNRRGFVHKIESVPSDNYVGIAILDIDNFKSVNDIYGHEAGDEALIHLARTIKGSLRGTDMVSRFGGEEFVVMVNASNSEQVKAVLERIRRAIEVSPCTLKSGGDIHMTVSCGAVVLSTLNGARSVSDIWSEYELKQADNLLYKAKSQGKNQVCIS